MSALKIDNELLTQFEKRLDPRHPEAGEFSSKVLGYGEISTVLEIDFGDGKDLAYKRMPMFFSDAEANSYEALYREYIQILNDQVGIRVVNSDITHVKHQAHNRVVIYIVQEKLPAITIGHKAIHQLSPQDIHRLVIRILSELSKVFEFNQDNKGKLEVGIDGQISNWAIVNFDQAGRGLGESIDLVYIDTSTPFVLKGGQEGLDPELFLRSAPSFLVWILRTLFLEDVMTRYYDFRKVSIDLIANFYKEGRPELIPDLIQATNEFFLSRVSGDHFKPLCEDEIRSYYREDAWIWRLYLAFRKVDRWLYSLLGKYYPYILPDKIQR